MTDLEGDLGNAAKASGQIQVTEVLSQLHTETFGLAFIKFLAKNLGEVEILEFVSDFFRLRVPRGDRTIGFIFGLIENVKDEFRMSEYSVSQTTLEQIFQSFARVTIRGAMEKRVYRQSEEGVTMFKTIEGVETKVGSIEGAEWTEKMRVSIKEAEEMVDTDEPRLDQEEEQKINHDEESKQPEEMDDVDEKMPDSIVADNKLPGTTDFNKVEPAKVV